MVLLPSIKPEYLAELCARPWLSQGQAVQMLRLRCQALVRENAEDISKAGSDYCADHLVRELKGVRTACCKSEASIDRYVLHYLNAAPLLVNCKAVEEALVRRYPGIGIEALERIAPSAFILHDPPKPKALNEDEANRLVREAEKLFQLVLSSHPLGDRLEDRDADFMSGLSMWLASTAVSATTLSDAEITEEDLVSELGIEKFYRPAPRMQISKADDLAPYLRRITKNLLNDLIGAKGRRPSGSIEELPEPTVRESDGSTFEERRGLLRDGIVPIVREFLRTHAEFAEPLVAAYGDIKPNAWIVRENVPREYCSDIEFLRTAGVNLPVATRKRGGQLTRIRSAVRGDLINPIRALYNETGVRSRAGKRDTTADQPFKPLKRWDSIEDWVKHTGSRRPTFEELRQLLFPLLARDFLVRRHGRGEHSENLDVTVSSRNPGRRVLKVREFVTGRGFSAIVTGPYAVKVGEEVKILSARSTLGGKTARVAWVNSESTGSTVGFEIIKA